ncbi:MAG TPA: DUF4124 domain-containing protein [Gammaproteobacteria bacterium]|nr:DUF4124 domain-containing protein [Gammaproteobacteria bacterium]
MKKLLLIALILVAVAAGYVYLHPTLRSKVHSTLERETPRIAPDQETTTLYKWRDADGHWQLSSEPPPPGTPYETKHYRDDTNVVPPSVFTGQPEKR